MARRAKGYYRGRASYYGGRAKSFGKKAYAKSGLNLSVPFLAGLAGAFVMPADPRIDMVGVAVATVPIKGLGKVKGVAQGYVFGQAMQHYVLPMVGINIPDVLNGSQLLGQAGNAIQNAI